MNTGSGPGALTGFIAGKTGTSAGPLSSDIRGRDWIQLHKGRLSGVLF